MREVMPAPTAPGTVLFSFKLTIGKTAIAQVPLYTNEAIASLPIKRGDLIETKFLQYALSSLDPELGANHAVLGKVLNKEKLQHLQVPLPPLAEQQRIVDVLDRAAAIQRLRRAAEEKAREIIPALFVDMFGDPEKNPKGWEKSPMASLVKIRSSVVVPDLNVDSDLLCIGPDAISKDHGEVIATTKVKDINPKSGKYKFFPGDVLYSKIRPALRKATVVDELGYCSADMYAMIPSDRLTKEF
jgi:type I restriction enzyme S subunit